MIELSSLPPEDALRNTPLSGAFIRSSIQLPIDVTHSEAERQKILARRRAGERQWTPWKSILPTWPIAKITYNQLSETWTNNSQFTFEKP